MKSEILQMLSAIFVQNREWIEKIQIYHSYKLLIFPKTRIDTVNGKLYYTKQKLEKIKEIGWNENSILSIACIIRSEMKSMKNTIPWPSQAND